MKIIRGFNYKDKSLDWFLEECPEHEFNTFIYNLVIKYAKRIEFKFETLFNEVYMDCIQITNDKHPELDFYYKYKNATYKGGKSDIEWYFTYFYILHNYKCDSSSVCLSFFLKNWNQTWVKDSYFINITHKMISDVENFIDQLNKEKKLEKINFQYCAPPVPSVIDYKSWQLFTDYFEQDMILEVLSNYENDLTKLEAIERIENAWRTLGTINPEEDTFPF